MIQRRTHLARPVFLATIVFALFCFISNHVDAQRIESDFRIADARLLSPSMGWTLVWQDPVKSPDGTLLNPQRLYWTDDNGKTWRDITPSIRANEQIGQLFFSDRSHGWGIISNATDDLFDPATPFTIVATRDGGKSWTALPVFNRSMYQGTQGRVAPSYLHFLDGRRGWFMWLLEHAGGAGLLFSTTDGGETWKQLPAPPSAKPIEFASEQIWWTVNGEPNDELWVTHDGGMNWREVDVPIPSMLKKSARNFFAPKFFDPLDGVLPASVQRASDTYTFFTYATRDGGESWQSTSFDGPWNEPCFAGKLVLWVSGEDRSKISIRRDGHSTSSVLPNGLAPTGGVGYPDFVDDLNAWVIYSNGRTSLSGANPQRIVHNELLSTTDGGKTFQIITPRVEAKKP